MARTVGTLRSRPISVFVLDEIRIYREGLTDLLRQAGVDVVGNAADVSAAVAALEVCPADLVLLDVGGAEGVAAIGMLLDRLPDAAVIAFGLAGTEEEVIACAELGASGYVTREDALEDLVRTIETVDGGGMPCSPQIAAALMRRLARRTSDASSERRARLTRREREVVDLIDEGLSNKQIAQRLVIEVATVKNHVHNVLEKLGVHRRAEAAAWARKTSRGRGVARPPRDGGDRRDVPAPR